MSVPSAGSAISISVVIVLYRHAPNESPAFKSLQEALRHSSLGHFDATILLFDNSPLADSPSLLPATVKYHTVGYNAGLATAYNWALHEAQSAGSSWLLLLDQDTNLPEDFFQSLTEQLRLYHSDPQVAAIVPAVRSNGVIVSPKSVGFFGLRPLDRPVRRVHNREIMAINSGTLLRCEFIHSIGGFDTTYWLDYLDHWLFRQIYAHSKKVSVSNGVLEHKLSVQDYRGSVSPERYQSILDAESSFILSYKSPVQVRFHLFRLSFRCVKLLAIRRPEMASMTFRRIFELLSPKARLPKEERR